MSGMRARRRFVAAMLAFAALLPLVWSLEGVQSALSPVAEWTASAALLFLDAIGVEVARRGTTLSHAQGFSCEIDLACTGLPIIALFTTALFAWPASRRQRISALCIALPALLAVNQLRIVHLVWVGISAPAWFDIAHDVLWRAASIILLALGWMAWRRRASAEPLPSLPVREVSRTPGVTSGEAPFRGPLRCEFESTGPC